MPEHAVEWRRNIDSWNYAHQVLSTPPDGSMGYVRDECRCARRESHGDGERKEWPLRLAHLPCSTQFDSTWMSDFAGIWWCPRCGAEIPKEEVPDVFTQTPPASTPESETAE